MRTLVLLCVLAGCASEPEMCVSAEGTYDVRYVSRTGGCGDVNIVAELDFGPYESTNCTGSREQSMDGCTYEYDLVCEDAMGGTALEIRGLTRGNADASVLVGVDFMCLYFADGTLDCCDTYDTSWTRL